MEQKIIILEFRLYIFHFLSKKETYHNTYYSNYDKRNGHGKSLSSKSIKYYQITWYNSCNTSKNTTYQNYNKFSNHEQNYYLDDIGIFYFSIGRFKSFPHSPQLPRYTLTFLKPIFFNDR